MLLRIGHAIAAHPSAIPSAMKFATRKLAVLGLAVQGLSVLGIGVLGIGILGIGTVCEASAPIDFNRDIRPILSDKCFQCHGPDEGERQTSLRLDRADSARAQLESGGHAIVPGDADASQMIHRLTSPDDDVRMPPAESGKQISPEELRKIRRWIAEGATWSEHWSFVPPTRPELPLVRDHRWAKNAIDRFVLAKLESEGADVAGPAPEADRVALLRRVSLDLTGLPPTPQEVDAFLADKRVGAYQRIVDRLIQSSRYGEHQARYWLDVARYGDTHGLHLDNERSIWPYRDWVIQALNENRPFDQFTVDQLAGDLIPSSTLEQRIATGFHRCNVTTSEGGSIDQEYLVRYAVDRAETTATTWLGLTVGCAACHDHKFDPVSQKEFYQLFAYFYSLTEKPMDGNALLPPPSIKAPTLAQRFRQKVLKSRQLALNSDLEVARNSAQARLPQWTREYLSGRKNEIDSDRHMSLLSARRGGRKDGGCLDHRCIGGSDRSRTRPVDARHVFAGRRHGTRDDQQRRRVLGCGGLEWWFCASTARRTSISVRSLHFGVMLRLRSPRGST